MEKWDFDRQLSLFEKSGIPLLPEGAAPINNHLARSSLFSPIKRGKRTMHKGAVLASQGGVTLKYHGEQLDMSDQNVLLHAYRLAAGKTPEDDEYSVKSTPGNPDLAVRTKESKNAQVLINRAKFLEAIHMVKSGPNYKWLHQSLIRLASCLVEVDTDRFTATFKFIGPPQLDKETGAYFFHIPKSSFAFFYDQAFGYVNLDRRFTLEVRPDLASWIQSFAVTHTKDREHRFSLGHIQELCGQTREPRKFRAAFKEAIRELVKKGEFENAEVDLDDVFRFQRAKQ